MTNLKSFDYNGQAIYRRDDGFVNLTQMCNANGKRLKDFLDKHRTLKVIHTLYAIQSGTVKHVLDTVEGETWGHFQIAAELAYQSDANFSVWFNLTFYGENPLKQKPCLDLDNFLEWKNEYFPWENDKTNQKQKQGQVYFILNETRNILKIGFTASDPESRLNSFKSGAVGEKLVILGAVPGTMETESMYHSYFASYLVKGEWFQYTDEVKSFIQQVLSSD